MPIASGVWVAPVGTKLGESGWQRIGTTANGVTMTEPFTLSSDRAAIWFDESGEWSAKGWKPAGFANETPAWLRPRADPLTDHMLQLQDIVNKASRDYSIKYPATWSTGIREQQWLDAVENYAMPQRFFVGIDEATFNERSKPMGLTKSHEYTDSDGDTIEVSEATSWGVDVTALLEATDKEGGQSAAVYVNAADSVPLALNVLGYDRPGILGGFNTTIGAGFSSGVVIGSTEHRDRILATAVAYLKSVDRHDQRADERKAIKTRADEARDRVLERLTTVADCGISPTSLKTVTAAIAEYESAYADLAASS